VLGLPFAFAHHFMPHNTDAAMELYRTNFHASEYLDEPYAIVACAAIAASDDERARYLAGPARLSMARLRAGRPTRFPTPEEAAEHKFSAAEEASVSTLAGSAAIGGPETVRAKLDELAARTQADELMITTMVHDHADRVRSYELIAEAYNLAAPLAAAGSEN
jgi:luciferase family oxidoreductase group 1